MLPAQGQDQSLPKAEQDRQIPSIGYDLGASTFFASQLAQRRDDRGQQLDDDRSADVGHDAQRTDRAFLESAPGEQAVEPDHRIAPRRLGLALEEERQSISIQPRYRRHGNQPADTEDQSCEDNP